MENNSRHVEKVFSFWPCPSLHGSSSSWRQLTDNALTDVLSVMKQSIKHLICSWWTSDCRRVRLALLMKLNKWEGNTKERLQTGPDNQSFTPPCFYFPLPSFPPVCLPLLLYLPHTVSHAFKRLSSPNSISFLLWYISIILFPSIFYYFYRLFPNSSFSFCLFPQIKNCSCNSFSLSAAVDL